MKYIRFSPYLFILLMGLIVGAAVSQFNNAVFSSDTRLKVIEIGHEVIDTFDREVSVKTALNQTLVAAFANQPDMSKEAFSKIAARLYKNNPDIINFATAPNLVIEYVYPEKQNVAAIGLDLSKRPNMIGDIQLAIEKRSTVFGSPIDLIQGGRGFVTRSPVFVDDESGTGHRLWGIVTFVIDETLFFQNSGLLSVDPSLEIALLDANDKVVFGNAGIFANDPLLLDVPMPVGVWQLAVVPKGGWPTSAPNQIYIWISVLLLSAVAMAIYYAFQQSRMRRQGAEVRLKSALDVIDDGFALFDANDRFVMCNTKFLDIHTRMSAAIRPGASFEDIIRFGVEIGEYPNAKGREEAWVKERVEGHRRADTVVEQQLADGRWLKIADRKTKNGETVGSRVDITDLKNALAEAEASNKAKTSFLNSISHELRTPLTVVLGYNAFIKNPDVLPSFKKLAAAMKEPPEAGDTMLDLLGDFRNEMSNFATKIDTSGKHLQVLIESILDLAAIERGTLRLDLKTVDAESLVAEVSDEFRDEARAKGIELVVKTEAVELQADKKRLRQILFNLVGNAIKFADQGRVALEVSSHGGNAVFHVTDEGHGIDPKHHEAIFNPFWQIDASSARASGGIGHGLAMSKYLIDLHGGTITLKSELGVGSTFTFTIPLNTKPKVVACNADQLVGTEK